MRGPLCIAACALLLPQTACQPDRPPNVLVVVFDSTRLDETSYLEPARGRTPRLDALAASGVRFRRARALYTWTVPSHVALFTGCEVTPGAYPDAPARGGGSCDPEEASIFAALREHGYRTYAFSANTSVHPNTLSALAEVDDALAGDDVLPPADVEAILARYGAWLEPAGDARRDAQRARRNRRIVERDARVVNAVALEAVDRHREETPGRPFLLFVNYNDPHDPYHPSPPFDTARTAGASRFNGDLWDPARRARDPGRRGRALSDSSAGMSHGDILRARDLHRGEVAYADLHLGLLLDGLEQRGALDGSAIVVTADHGEAFGEGGRMAHAGADLDVLLDVPLVMVLPGIAPAEIELPVDHRDVKPTLMAWLGLPDPHSRGRNLLPLLRGETTELERASWAPPTIRRPVEDPARQRALEAELRALNYLEE